MFTTAAPAQTIPSQSPGYHYLEVKSLWGIFSNTNGQECCGSCIEDNSIVFIRMISIIVELHVMACVLRIREHLYWFVFSFICLVWNANGSLLNPHPYHTTPEWEFNSASRASLQLIVSTLWPHTIHWLDPSHAVRCPVNFIDLIICQYISHWSKEITEVSNPCTRNSDITFANKRAFN